MTPVTTVAQAFEAIQRAKAGAADFRTNFFPAQAKLQGWIDHGELFGEFRPRCVFFTRKDRDFWHLYYCASDLAALEGESGELPSLKTQRVAIDLVGSEASLGEVVELVKRAGFRPYARLMRLTRASQAGAAESSPEGTQVIWADPKDRSAIMDLLEACFDRYADQLPMPYEVDAALDARQILAVKWEGALAALLFFETLGLTSTIRYWVVASQFRSHRFGSALIRYYFGAQSAVRRFILWVTASNEDAVTKYRHYGYNPDGLVDHVLVNEMIPA
jgi:GNAT superfamily N-acetyltransferase